MEKLNNLIEKFDIENQNTEGKLSNQQNNIVSHQTVVEIIKNSNPEEIVNSFDLIKNLVKESENEQISISQNKDNKERNNKDDQDKNIYVLSDEAQATIGIMIDIEKGVIWLKNW